MKRIISLLPVFLLCFFAEKSFSQQSKIDSLQQELKTAKEDTNKVNTLNLLGKQYYIVGDYDKTVKYSKEALQLCEKIEFEKGKISAYLNIGVACFYQGNYPEALKQNSEALSISEKLKNKSGIVKSYNNMGLALTYQRKYSEALEMHRKALEIAKDAGDSAGIANAYNNCGIIYEEQSNYADALKSYLSALKIAEAKGDKKGIADAYFNIANVYSIQKSYADAIKNYTAALRPYEEAGFKQGLALCLATLGSCYQTIDSLEPALNFSERGYEVLATIGNGVDAAQTKNVIGNIKTRMGRYTEAADAFTSALKLFNEIGDTLDMADSYRGLGVVYYHKEQYNESLKNLNKALELAKASGYGNTGFMSGIYGTIAEVYAKKNDYKNAFLNHQQYFALNDSVYSETKSRQIAEMQTRFETEKKDNDIALLNKDKEIQHAEIKKQKFQKYSYIGSLGVVIVLLLFGYRNYRIRQALRLQDIRNKIAGDLHDDIGSTLNSISVYSEVARRKDAGQDEALEMIGEASRKIIDAMSDIVWTVNPDNDSFAKILFRMKSLAYNLFRAKKIEYTFHADESLNEKKLRLEDRRNFYLIFKEAVNNMVKYSDATQASITLTDENERIRLLIRDNGAGFDTAQENIGNGLKNMKRRAEEMQATFKIESRKGNGTQIELVLKI